MIIAPDKIANAQKEIKIKKTKRENIRNTI
jgi:hypothetical protein